LNWYDDVIVLSNLLNDYTIDVGKSYNVSLVSDGFA